MRVWVSIPTFQDPPWFHLLHYFIVQMKKLNLRGKEMTRSRSEADLRFGPWFGPLEFSKVSPELVISILAPSSHP